MRFYIRILTVLVLFAALVGCAKKDVINPESVFDAEAEFKTAQEHLDSGNYESARSALIDIKARDTSRKYAPFAQLKLAESYTLDDDPETAVEEYRRFLEAYPTHSYAMHAQYQIAMTYFKLIKDPERGYGAASRSVEEFLKLKERYPRNPYRATVDINIKKALKTMADYELMVGKFYYKNDSYEGALARFLPIIEEFSDYPKMGEVHYYTALTYLKLDNPDKARIHFQAALAARPGPDISKEAEEALRELQGPEVK